MEMKKINSSKLRTIGYDAPARLLQVQLDDGSRNRWGQTPLIAKNFERYKLLVDSWQLYDNSGAPPIFLDES